MSINIHKTTASLGIFSPGKIISLQLGKFHVCVKRLVIKSESQDGERSLSWTIFCLFNLF